MSDSCVVGNMVSWQDKKMKGKGGAGQPHFWKDRKKINPLASYLPKNVNACVIPYKRESFQVPFALETSHTFRIATRN